MLLKTVLSEEGWSKESLILDFGCGVASTVIKLREQGFQVMGTDFEGGMLDTARENMKKAGFDPGDVRGIEVETEFTEVQGTYRLPFDDKTFDIIFAEQVFEHVDDLDSVCASLSRILKDDGFIYSVFPTRYKVVEEHIGVPMAHWLPYSGFRARYIDCWHRLGVGINKKISGARQNEYLSKGVYYRPNRETDRLISTYFSIKDVSDRKFWATFAGKSRLFNNGPMVRARAAWERNFRNRHLILRKKS